MCRKTPIHQTSDQWDDYKVSSQNGIGDLFREYGEEYIKAYNPDKQKIKLIRAIRVCKSPAIGGVCYTCKSCGNKHYIYKSCGHSQCMICQSVKREQWVDKLKNRLLKVPYVHAVFTLPHQLHGLCRMNKDIIYSLIMKATWLTIKEVMKKEIEATPGITSVLHTFGSDMGYHIHTHSLVTFGGIDNNNKWQYPKNKNRITRYRTMCGAYKSIFLQLLKEAYNQNKIIYYETYDELKEEVVKLRWVVHTTFPTMDTNHIENYLGRYINRIAISNNRLKLLADKSKVIIVHNDYCRQVKGKSAPKLIKHLDPLVAINQILQHVLPRHFQKTRSYGLHNACSKTRAQVDESLKNNKQTIRTVFQIMNHLLGLDGMKCEQCGKEKFEIREIRKDKNFIYRFINIENKAPPYSVSHIANPKVNLNQKVTPIA